MKTLNITAARRHFGALLDAVQHEPVLIRRRNRDHTVIMSADEYVRLTGTKYLETRPAQSSKKTTDF